MGIKSIWKNYKVLIVMGTGLGLTHWGWYRINSNPIFNPAAEVQAPSFFPFFHDKNRDAKEK